MSYICHKSIWSILLVAPSLQWICGKGNLIKEETKTILISLAKVFSVSNHMIITTLIFCGEIRKQKNKKNASTLGSNCYSPYSGSFWICMKETKCI